MNTLPSAAELETVYKKIDIKANPSQYNVGDILILRSVNQILPIKIMANPNVGLDTKYVSLKMLNTSFEPIDDRTIMMSKQSPFFNEYTFYKKTNNSPLAAAGGALKRKNKGNKKTKQRKQRKSRKYTRRAL